MRRIPEFSVTHPVSVLMIVLAVTLLGWISFQRLGIDLFPRLDSPRLFMEIEAEGFRMSGASGHATTGGARPPQPEEGRTP